MLKVLEALESVVRDWRRRVVARSNGSVNTATMEAGEVGRRAKARNRAEVQRSVWRTYWWMVVSLAPADVGSDIEYRIRAV